MCHMMLSLPLTHCKPGIQDSALLKVPATGLSCLAQVFFLMCRQLDSTVGGQASLSQFISDKKALVAFFYPRASHQSCCSILSLHPQHTDSWSGCELGGCSLVSHASGLPALTLKHMLFCFSLPSRAGLQPIITTESKTAVTTHRNSTEPELVEEGHGPRRIDSNAPCPGCHRCGHALQMGTQSCRMDTVMLSCTTGRHL